MEVIAVFVAAALYGHGVSRQYAPCNSRQVAMLDQTQFVTLAHWKYWIRWQDAVVHDVQGYSHQNVRVDSDRYGATVVNSSHSLNRIFAHTAGGDVFFDAYTSSFAAAPGNNLRLVYVGGGGYLGRLKLAYNASNGSAVTFTDWRKQFPSVGAVVLVGVLFMIAAIFFEAIATGPLRTSAGFQDWRGIAPWAVRLCVPLGLASFAGAIYRFVMKMYFISKIESMTR